jgi:hypothetical protein
MRSLEFVGRAPSPARVPLDPLVRYSNHLRESWKRPTRASGRRPVVRPTIYAERSLVAKRTELAHA